MSSAVVPPAGLQSQASSRCGERGTSVIPPQSETGAPSQVSAEMPATSQHCEQDWWSVPRAGSLLQGDSNGMPPPGGPPASRLFSAQNPWPVMTRHQQFKTKVSVSQMGPHRAMLSLWLQNTPPVTRARWPTAPSPHTCARQPASPGMVCIPSSPARRSVACR